MPFKTTGGKFKNMKEKLTIQEYKEIEQLIDCALDASNKKEAQKYIDELQSYRYFFNGRANNILSELIGYVQDASGRVTEKECRIDSVTSKLCILKRYGVE